MRALATGLAVLLLCAGRAAAQEVRTAVAPGSITVGDVFRVAVRVDVPPGMRAVLPDSLPVSGDVENAGTRALHEERLPDGGIRYTALYPLAAWRPDTLALPPVAIRLIGGEGERRLDADLPVVVLGSVLPADTTGVEPRPPKDVLGPSRVWWLYAAAAGAALLALALAAILLWRRRRRRPVSIQVQPVPIPTAREAALAMLARARELGLLERGDFRTFYSLVSEAVRHYAAALDPRWSPDLTTSEILARLRAGAGAIQVEPVERVLSAADLAKFARGRPGAELALAHWEAARQWIGTVERAEQESAPQAAPAVEPAEVGVA